MKTTSLYEQYEHGADNVRVGPSASGYGLYAARRLSDAAEVGRLTGRIIHDPDYEGSDYAIDLGDGATLEPIAPFRFLNHSCQPNCCLVVYEEQDNDGVPVNRSTLLETLRTIEQNEELTIDYGWEAEAAIPCNCGSDNCRHWVVAEHELHRLDVPRKRTLKPR